LDKDDVTLIDIRDYPLPQFSVDIEQAEGSPENAGRLKTLFDDHDAFIISSPEHNGSMPVIFKNMIDWLSRLEGTIFQDKPILLMSASPGQGGGKTNLNNLLSLVPWWGGKVVSHLSVGNFSDVFDGASGNFTDPELDGKARDAIGILKGAL